MSRLLTVVLLCVQLFSTAIAQQPLPSAPPPPVPQNKNQKPVQEDEVVKITTNLVQVDAVITDREGRRIVDLRPDEIEMFEDGKRQAITNFSYLALGVPTAKSGMVVKAVDKNAPPVPTDPLKPEQVQRSIALVVDDLGLSFESAHFVRQSLRKFVDQQLQPNDLVAIIRTGAGIGALQQFTSDKRQLYAAIEKVRWNPNGVGGIGAFPPMGSDLTLHRENDDKPDHPPTPDEDINKLREDVFAAGTLGALAYVVRGLRTLPGRKSVVLFSDGFRIFRPEDALTNERILLALHRLTDLANRAAVVIYTLDARGLPVIGLTAADSTAMMSPAQVEKQLEQRSANLFESQMGLKYLADQTGGIAIRNNNDLTGGLQKILDDQEGYYLVGYRPDDETFDRVKGRTRFHHIELKVKRAGKYNVRMRTGFYGVANEEKATASTPLEQIVNALISPFGSSQIHLRLTSLFINDAEAGSAVRSFMHVDAKDLHFVDEPEGVHKAEFDVVAVTFGDNGQVIEQFSYTQTLRVKGDSYGRILNNGFTYNMTVPINKAGAYQLRTALRDKATEKVGAATQFIEVPDIKKNKLMISGILMRGLPLASYFKSMGVKNDDAQSITDIDTPAAAGPGVRQLQTGMALVYGFTIYNAQIDKATNKPKLKIQMRVFKDGQQLFLGDDLPFDPGNQVDLKRLAAGGGLQMGMAMSPGDYVLQVIVTDSAKEKPRVATQWIDFEIVK